MSDFITNAELLIEAERLCDENDELKAENARLREQIHWLKRGDVLHVLTDQELAEQQKREREMQASITALDEENAKLRELARDLYDSIDSVYWDGEYATKARFAPLMRELGIEVEL